MPRSTVTGTDTHVPRSTHLAEDRQQHVGADEDAWLGDQSLVAHPGQGTLEEGPRGPQAPAPAPAAGAPVPGPQLPGHCPLDQRIGLGVAGMLRRIGLHARVDTAAGRIHVRGAELGRWLRQESWWVAPPAAAAGAAAPSSLSPAVRWRLLALAH